MPTSHKDNARNVKTKANDIIVTINGIIKVNVTTYSLIKIFQFK